MHRDGERLTLGVRRSFTGRALLPRGEIEDVTLVFEGSVVSEVRPAEAGAPRQAGLLIPGLVNAHTQFDVSHLGQVPGGDGLPSWIRAQFARRGELRDTDAAREASIAARAVEGACTAAVSDIAGDASTAEVLRAAGLQGVVQRERVGQDRARTRSGVDEAPSLHRRREGGIVERPTAHAPYSTHPDLARATLSVGPHGVAAAVNLAEDAAERAFLEEGAGPFAELLDAVGVQWSFAGPLAGPIDWLRAVGGLGPHVCAVHGVDLRVDELRALADHDVGLVLCVRSNLHIGGKAPDVHAMLECGLRLGLGTDGLVACADGDVLGEIPALHRLVPEVDGATWLHLATAGGASVLGLSDVGTFRPGSAPGLVLLDSDEKDLCVRAPQRRWLVHPASDPAGVRIS